MDDEAITKMSTSLPSEQNLPIPVRSNLDLQPNDQSFREGKSVFWRKGREGREGLSTYPIFVLLFSILCTTVLSHTVLCTTFTYRSLYYCSAQL
jgi:hypothetical protein